LAQRARFYQGLTFEAEGLWQAAEQVYQAYLGNRNGSEDNPEVSARFYERLAETHLSQGDLHSAERHARESLTINRKSGNRFGEAMNLETLGKIYERLRDLPGAQEALENSLIILDEVDRGFDKAKVYNDLADIYLSFWRYEEA